MLLAITAMEEMPAGQKTVAYVLAVTMLVVAVELVRRRKLREEYALVWLGTGLLLLLLAWQHQWLAWFQKLIAARSPVSALFFGGLVFLMLLCLQFSVRLSKMSFRHKTTVQRLALVEKQLAELRERYERR
ncbi:MAG TPA: DUF2304 domain-containing protein [Planctomycetota bacterium]|nr:DUF2304 domain-containing protein [Planctomycetota bacterium]